MNAISQGEKGGGGEGGKGGGGGERDKVGGNFKSGWIPVIS